MLLQLEIQNIALIDKVCIEFGRGLNIMTGETGAGKSIIIDSINAILGSRLSKDLIRTGKEKAAIEAVFEIEPGRLDDVFESLGIEPEDDGTLIISREYTLAGKNTCRINGKIATASMLKEISERIIDIHGQYDNQSLLRTESHIELLDSFGGEAIGLLKQEYNALLSGYRDIKHKLKQITGDKNERERKIDLLKFQIEEIKKAKLKLNEEEKLNNQKLLLINSEKIINSLTGAYDLLFGESSTKTSASDNIRQAALGLSSISKLNERFAGIASRLEDLSYQIDDIIDDIRKERDNTEYNPGLLEQTEERLDLIYRLKRKYGSSIEEILEYVKKIEQELEETIKSEEIIKGLNDKLSNIDEKLFEIAGKMNAERVKASSILESKISFELDDLEMKKARFKVNLEFDDYGNLNSERRYNANGLNKVEFLISPNAGEPLKPLSKIASGGEMSRIMLAIKNILANVDKMPTLIFDEIDIGISGKAAQKVGEKLSYISKNHQVICVTHLAQIACMADNHFLIEKVSSEDNTTTRVGRLDGKEAKNEIARILGGSSISDITLKHAEEMLENAQKFKIG